MNIDVLIEQLINLKSEGAETVEVMDSYQGYYYKIEDIFGGSLKRNTSTVYLDVRFDGVD